MSRKMVKISHPKVEGATALVPESAVKHHQKAGWTVVTDDAAADDADQRPTDYTSLKKAELEAEVERRNSERTPDSQITVDGNGTVEDLRNALVADDQR